jgi:hypothetical protein
MAEKIDNLWDEEHEGYPIGVIGKDPSSPKERVIILDHSPSQVPDYVRGITIKGNIIKIPNYLKESAKKAKMGTRVFAGKSKVLKL